MRISRLVAFAFAPVIASALLGGLATPAMADPQDVSVGGVWVAKITHDAPNYSADQRVVEVSKRITEILSNPVYRNRGAAVTVRPMGAAAAIFVNDQLVMTVIPEDTSGTDVSTVELARQWAQRLAQGLSKALPDANLHTF